MALATGTLLSIAGLIALFKGEDWAKSLSAFLSDPSGDKAQKALAIMARKVRETGMSETAALSMLSREGESPIATMSPEEQALMGTTFGTGQAAAPAMPDEDDVTADDDRLESALGVAPSRLRRAMLPSVHPILEVFGDTPETVEQQLIQMR